MSVIECGEYYIRTGRIPPVNLTTWVAVYNLLVNAGYEGLM